VTYTPPNTPPTISDIADQTINEDGVTSALAFVVGDSQTAAGSLAVSAVSSNTALVPNANITLGGSGVNRTVTIRPVQNLNGVTTITVTVTDGGSLSVSDSFQVTVTPLNDAPTISTISNQTTSTGVATSALPFTIADIDTALTSLTLARASSNTTLVPTGNIVISGTGANRSIVVTPAPGATGVATITITVSDGSLSTPTSFLLTVTAPPSTFRISSMRRVGTNGVNVELKFPSESGAVYRVQKSPSMLTGTWTDAGLSANGTGAELTMLVPNAGLSGLYYFRVVRQ
jgi:Bacterial Ig domain